MESIHWGLGSGLGALLGGFAYSSFGAVHLFQVSALISVFSMMLATAASILHGAIPAPEGAAFAALPSASLDGVEEGCDPDSPSTSPLHCCPSDSKCKASCPDVPNSSRNEYALVHVNSEKNCD